MKFISNKDYIKYPRCPNADCDSEGIEGELMESGENAAFRDCECEKCGTLWTEEFKLVGYELSDPDNC